MRKNKNVTKPVEVFLKVRAAINIKSTERLRKIKSEKCSMELETQRCHYSYGLTKATRRVN
jgi:hypothetical protein